MKSIFTFLLGAALLTGTAHAQTGGNELKALLIDTIDCHLSGFNRLRIQGPFAIYLKQGDTESVIMQAPDEIKNRLVAEIDGDGTLQIRNKHDNWGWGEKSWYSEKGYWHHHHDRIKVYITARKLEGISISGSGIVSLENDITANTLNVRISGSGELTGKIDVKKLQSKISGSGKIKLSGNAENSHIKVRGSGDFAGGELATVTSSVHISGSGHASINASDKVNATLHGSAGVSYTGTAKINSSKSGSAEINRF